MILYIKRCFQNFIFRYLVMLGKGLLVVGLSLFVSCTVVNEMSGKNDQDQAWKELKEYYLKYTELKKLNEGLEWLELLNTVQNNPALTDGSEVVNVDDTYPGDGPTESSVEKGACYLDNTGSAPGRDWCCYDIKEADCFNSISMFGDGYEVTFTGGESTESTCTSQGFSECMTNDTLSCCY